MDWNAQLQNFAEKKLDKVELNSKLEKLAKLRDSFSRWQPTEKRVDLSAEIDDLQNSIIDSLQEAGLDHLTTKKFTLSIRSVPTYFRIQSKNRLVSALKRRKLNKFLIPDYSVGMKDLKEYLLATNSTLPGLRKISNQKSLYVFELSSEDNLPPDSSAGDVQPNPQLFVHKDISKDIELKEPAKYYKNLWADLRYLGNSAYPALLQGREWGGWTMDEIKKRFALIVDVLRSIKFPILEERDNNSSWWRLYFLSEPFMESSPPTKKHVEEWNTERAEILEAAKHSEDGDPASKVDNFAIPNLQSLISGMEGIYLVEPHGELIWDGSKSLIVKSVKFSSMTHKPLLLISGKRCFGAIVLHDPIPIADKSSFGQQYPKHQISNEDRKSWWDDNWPLFGYSFVWFIRLPKPVSVSIPQGIQTFIDAGHTQLS